VGRDDPALDVTAALLSYAQQSAGQLFRGHPLCGYLLKSRSPSCGMGSTPLFDAAGREFATGSGIQARYFQTELPWLVFQEECALTGESGAQRFDLQCRLVFDAMHAGRAPLEALHRHYRFLIDILPERDQRRLAAATAGSHGQYLALLHAACRPLPDERLLDLFL
jgi:hypothetical protein